MHNRPKIPLISLFLLLIKDLEKVKWLKLLQLALFLRIEAISREPSHIAFTVISFGERTRFHTASSIGSRSFSQAISATVQGELGESLSSQIR